MQATHEIMNKTISSADIILSVNTHISFIEELTGQGIFQDIVCLYCIIQNFIFYLQIKDEKNKIGKSD